MMEHEIQVYESKPLTAKDIKGQVDLIQDVMKQVMHDKEHYGVIPGCGDKPALLKPGAEKLNLTFRMAPDPETDMVDLGNGHREYRVKCILRAIESGRTLGAGVGSASTMETKWRFRKSERKCPSCGQEAIVKGKNEYGGGWVCFGKKGGCGAKFKDGDTSIEAQQVGRVEYDNPADYYNTCWKMAKKRALVDAVLTVTAASDIFTQDVEEMVENGTITPPPETKKPPIQEPQKKAPDKPPEPQAHSSVTVAVDSVEVKTGKGSKGDRTWTLYIVHAGGEKYNTFSQTFGDLAKRSLDEKINAVISWSQTEKGKKLENIVIEPPGGYDAPGDEANAQE